MGEFDLTTRVQNALEEIRPFLMNDGVREIVVWRV